MALKQRGLGTGLASLIPQKQFTMAQHGALAEAHDPVFEEATAFADKVVHEKPLDDAEVVLIDPRMISANPYQPRTKFEESEQRALTESMRRHGMIQPLLVTRTGSGNYQLIAGERRLRAALALGLPKVKAIVRQIHSSNEQVELALIENIQREDLNPVELAHAYKDVLLRFEYTQEELADILGKSRPLIANTIRLLELPQEILESLEKGEITAGHAKVLLGLKGKDAQLTLWKKVTLHSLTVRAAEREVRHGAHRVARRAEKSGDPHLKAIEARLENKFGTKVSIKGSLEKGQIIIDYFSKEELKRIASEEDAKNAQKSI